MFAEDITRALSELRGHASERLPSFATVRRATGDYVKGADGYEVPEWVDVHTDEPFALAGSSSGDGGTRRVTIGGVEFQQATGVGKFRHDLTDLADGDFIDITDGEWAGTVLRVVEAVKKDQATARRVPVEGVERPAEWGAA